jgi:site-specific DNA recombinase
MTNSLYYSSLKGRCLAYLRVSTPRQGEGVSLLTQREEIGKFAARQGLLVTGWYEEKTSAARRGRPVFAEILRMLRRREAHGLIVYKVDRSARNLKDWADLGELIDQGIPVYFAGDGLDLSSRSGRLAADIQAVVAADYVRNLREEAKRGIRKRLEQGLYPMRAPVGYLDCGPGKPKAIDPDRGPLVRLAFTWYASGEYTLRELQILLENLGLRNRRGGRVSVNGLSHLLRNPFYMGFIRLRTKGHLYCGLHEPIVSRELFFKVQDHLRSRLWPRRRTLGHRFSRKLRCATCTRALIGSESKSRVYYRCQTISCPTTSVREDAVQAFWGSIRMTENLEMAWVSGKKISASRSGAIQENDVSSSIPLGSLPASSESDVPEPLRALENPNVRLVADV